MTMQSANDANRVNSATGLASLIFPASVAIMVPFLSPVIVGGLVEASGWSEKQAGLLVSTEMGFWAWSALAGLVWLNRVPWRVAALIGCSLLVLANLASCFVTTQAMLMTLRAISGVGSGTLVALCYGGLAQTEKPHRNYGFFSMNQMALAICCLAFLPIAINGPGADTESKVAAVLATVGVTEAVGMNAFYITMLALAIAATACVVLWIPRRPERLETAKKNNLPINWLFAIVMLGAVFILMISQQGLWTYAERMGMAAGIDRTTVAATLTLGAASGLLGASAVAAIGSRFSRPLVITVIVGLHLCALAVFLLHMTPQTFLLGILLHKFSWNFMIPYQLGMLAEVERSGKAAVLGTFITSTGISTGAAIAAFAVTDYGYQGIIVESMLFAVIYMGIMLFVHTRLRSVQRVAAAAA